MVEAIPTQTMKTFSQRLTLSLVAAAIATLSSCTYEGRVIEQQQFRLGERTFVQKRVLMCRDPYEARVIVIEIY